MKLPQILAISALVVASGAIGAFATTSFVDQGLTTSNFAKEGGALLTGHVTYTVKDIDGNVKEIRQSDNQIVNSGENCISKIMFKGASSTGNTVCVGATSDPWTSIRVGIGGGGAGPDPASQAQRYLLSDATKLSGTGLDGKVGAVTWTNSSGDGSSSVASVSIVATFTNDSGSSQDIDEAMLSNSTSNNTGPGLAIQDFTAITVGTSETLDVQWDMTIGAND